MGFKRLKFNFEEISISVPLDVSLRGVDPRDDDRKGRQFL